MAMRAATASLSLVVCASIAVPRPVAASPTVAAPLPIAAVLLGPSAGDPAQMSDEEKLEVAKKLYGEADEAFQSGDYANALTKFEEAYNVYAPGIHTFNINIGLAAFEVGDCIKAKQAFQRFLDLVSSHDARAMAQEKLIEIERTKCAEQQVASQPPADEEQPLAEAAPPIAEEEAPILSARREEREEAIKKERARRSAAKTHPMLIAGGVLTAAGAAALIGSGVSYAIAKKRADELADLASANPNTGFPAGNYSDEEVFDLDRNKLPANNAATIALLITGGVLVAVGVPLIAVGVIKQKQARRAVGSQRAQRRRPHLVGIAPAMTPGGGGAAALVRF